MTRVALETRRRSSRSTTRPVARRPIRAAAVVALTARAAPPEPSIGVTRATMCVSTPTCAVRPSAKGADTLQNRQVRSASPRRRRSPSCEGSGRSARGGSPSGPRPSSSGPRRMTHAATATSTARSTTAAQASARVKPTAPMIGMSAGATTTPPSVAPLNAMLTARPRRRSNHGARMMLIAAPLIDPQPTDITRKAG